MGTDKLLNDFLSKDPNLYGKLVKIDINTGYIIEQTRKIKHGMRVISEPKIYNALQSDVYIYTIEYEDPKIFTNITKAKFTLKYSAQWGDQEIDIFQCSICEEEIIDQRFEISHCPNCGSNVDWSE